ncbi:MAG: glutathione S-transferase family protein, partial [Candidatus Microthrix sp.]|nr:glutathione S-transferase family protein [Candidatus Microthrix sp.]
MSAETDDADETGAYRRNSDYITTRITRDGAERWPVEAGRYRLAAARACPWANRALIARRLYGLESSISLALAGP